MYSESGRRNIKEVTAYESGIVGEVQVQSSIGQSKVIEQLLQLARPLLHQTVNVRHPPEEKQAVNKQQGS